MLKEKEKEKDIIILTPQVLQMGVTIKLSKWM